MISRDVSEKKTRLPCDSERPGMRDPKGAGRCAFQVEVPPNPCENKHLIPNPSLGSGVCIVFRPFRINPGGGRASGQVTDAGHRRASADAIKEPLLIGCRPRSGSFVSVEEGQRARRGRGDKPVNGCFICRDDKIGRGCARTANTQAVNLDGLYKHWQPLLQSFSRGSSLTLV